jgi:hypothetical protein
MFRIRIFRKKIFFTSAAGRQPLRSGDSYSGIDPEVLKLYFLSRIILPISG